MVLLNGQVWEVLEQVRLRQVLWHRRATIFSTLEAAGLLKAMPQTTVAMTGRPVPNIATLTEVGKREIRRLASCRRDEVWEPEKTSKSVLTDRRPVEQTAAVSAQG
ncbi:hypothetical protein H0484_13260 [Pusillimonas sp. CC-YST705]|uniref:Uncharacterized protein n=1 Tax=Mesopusillimonas faecipullorum TaxID=2755040 RepID=A0ABS8CGQ0_9BURK|nr:hypothetical protein [Mesopusillimonas faecipullorum]MCB5364719.1 hypothetical protein [Mesopusillimonas faecipullorum]